MIKVIISGMFERSRIHKILSSYPEFEVIGLCNDNYDAIKLIDSKKPDVIILTASLKNNETGEIIFLIKSRCPKTALVLIIAYTEREYSYRAIAFGASAYLFENDMDTLSTAVKVAHNGSCFIGVNAATKLLPLFSRIVMNKLYPVENKSQSVPDTISCIELRIMVFITKGFSTKKIAEELHMAPGTIRNYISAIMRKTGTQNRNQVGIFVLKNKLISSIEKDS
ncbi:MAG: response regulator transcription factor [Treponema sp.]|jgi:DNA-binding NarL/FixJ family response regulator|nr:response regulator transcription factor [Treponema sp.]